MSNSKTVREHFNKCEEVTTVIRDANALLTKTKMELESARTVLEALVDYQHPKITMTMPYHLREKDRDANASPTYLIDRQIKRINALLGDRA